MSTLHFTPNTALALPALALAACTLLGGCAVGPDYVKPDAAAPVAYKENRGWKVAQPADSADRGPWWEVFGDAQLNALADQVDVSNQTVKAAAAQYEQARALVESARAAFFPTVGLNAAATRARAGSRVTTGTATGASGSAGIGNNVSLALNASWEADIWARCAVPPRRKRAARRPAPPTSRRRA